MNLLEKAINLALDAHKNQSDKAGQPYILHPLRLMMNMDSDIEKIIAVLHDVVEDSHFTLDDLIDDDFPTDVVDALDCLTKRKNEDYSDFISRISKNPLTTRVKIADISDNLDIKRLRIISDKDVLRIKKYHKALAYLKTLDLNNPKD